MKACLFYISTGAYNDSVDLNASANGADVEKSNAVGLDGGVGFVGGQRLGGAGDGRAGGADGDLRQAGISPGVHRQSPGGTVVLAFLIGTDGTVKRSEIKKSSGFPALDTAAVEALRLCHFKPGLKDGQPLEVWAPVAYVWSLGTRSVVPPGVPPVVPLAQNVPPYESPVAQAARYRQQALKDDACAQVNLGLIYLSGRGVKKSDTEAAGWFLKAAQHGNARGEMNLGLLYQSGRGVAQDDQEGARWMRLAADHGSDEAQVRLGRMYAIGRGVPHDDVEALRWYRLAAAHENAMAESRIGDHYAAGLGIERDDAQALAWYYKAVAHGDSHGEVALGAMFEQGHGVTADFRQAQKLYAWSAAKGNRAGMYRLAVMFEQGRGIDQSNADAMLWYQRAARMNNLKAVERLIDVYEKGQLGQAPNADEVLRLRASVQKLHDAGADEAQSL